MYDDEIVDKLKELEVTARKRKNDPIEKGYSNACKDQNFTNNVLNNENDDPTAKAYKDFADEIGNHADDNSNESDKGYVEKRMINFSITREDGKIIHSSETIPLNSLLINVIGATIGNCSKDGDEFKFYLNIEEDGSINLQIHAPNNKINNDLTSKLFDVMNDNNKMNSDVMKFICNFASKFRFETRSTNKGCNSSDDRWQHF